MLVMIIFSLGMVYIYPGGIVAALLQGEPLLGFLLAGPQLYTSLAAWYLIFYCPMDLVFQVYKTLRLQYVFPILQDWQRIGKNLRSKSFNYRI